MIIFLSCIAVPCSWSVPQAVLPGLLRCVKCLDKSLDRGPLQTTVACGCGMLLFNFVQLLGSRVLELLKVKSHNPALVLFFGPSSSMRLSRRTSGRMTQCSDQVRHMKEGERERERERETETHTGAVWPMPIVENGITLHHG